MNRTVALILLLPLFSGCALPSESDSITVPEARLGLQGGYYGDMVGPEPYHLYFSRERSQLIVTGDVQDCIGFRMVELEGSGQTLSGCLMPGTFETVVGDGSFFGGSGLGEVQPLSRPSRGQAFFISYKLTGQTWEEGSERELSWYGAPLHVQVLSIRRNVATFEASFKFYGDARIEKMQTETYRIQFRDGEASPLLFAKVHPDGSLSAIERIEDPVFEEPVPADLPAVDWAAQIASLQPLRQPITTGTGCPPGLDLQTALDIAYEQDSSIRPFLEQGYVTGVEQSYASEGIPLPSVFPHDDVHVSLALPDGTGAGFLVQLSHQPTGPQYTYIRDDERTVTDWPGIGPSTYPQTILPYCDALNKYLRLYPDERAIVLSFILAEGTDPHGPSLLPNSTWGRSAGWLDIHKPGGGSLYVSLATGLIQ